MNTTRQTPLRARVLLKSDYHPTIGVIQVDVSKGGVLYPPEFHLPRKSHGVVTNGYQTRDAAELGMFEGFDVADDMLCVEEVKGWIERGLAEEISTRSRYLTLIPAKPFTVDLGNQRFQIELGTETTPSGDGRNVPIRYWICARPLPESERRFPEILSAKSWPTVDDAMAAWENGFELDAPEVRTLVRQIAEGLRAAGKAK
jgi:hypothetical protein